MLVREEGWKSSVPIGYFYLTISILFFTDEALFDIHHLFDKKEIPGSKKKSDKSGSRAALKILLVFKYYINSQMLCCSIWIIYIKRRKLIVYMNQVIDKSENFIFISKF
jgi:hypothetical protein